jgi:hypothetical protein
MTATIVTQSVNAVQLFALIAVILFAVSTVYNAAARAVSPAILTAGLASLALAVLFLT